MLLRFTVSTDMTYIQSSVPGQGCSLHDSVFVLEPSQSLPPALASTMIFLSASFSPLPQVLEHLDQFPNGDQTQLTTKNVILFRK